MLPMTEKMKRAARDADFKRREQPRMVYQCGRGDTPAIRVEDAKGNVSYVAKPYVKPKSGTRKPTEAEDNANGRAMRRRRTRRLKAAGKPHSAR